jgi:glucose/arabinose dehydrogenase
MLEQMILRLLAAMLLQAAAGAEATPDAQFRLSPSELPAPYSTPPNDISPYFAREKPGFAPIVPPGFAINAFATRTQMKNARWLAVAPNGDTKTVVPDVLFEPHFAPLALVFYDAAQFPAQYKGDAFVAFHGSGPYGRPDGYKVVCVRFDHGKPTGAYEDSVTGFSAPGRESENGIVEPIVYGTPAGLAVAKDGSLLIADENAIWRVTYVGH